VRRGVFQFKRLMLCKSSL